MARTKGALNKNSSERPVTCNLSDEERVELVASIIVERILHDQQQGQLLLEELKKVELPCQTT